MIWINKNGSIDLERVIGEQDILISQALS